MVKTNLDKTLARKRKPSAKASREVVADRSHTVNGNPIQPNRIGRVMIGSYFSVLVHRQLKVIAAQEGKRIGELLSEGLNLVFATRKVPEIATFGNDSEG